MVAKPLLSWTFKALYKMQLVCYAVQLSILKVLIAVSNRTLMRNTTFSFKRLEQVTRLLCEYDNRNSSIQPQYEKLNHFYDSLIVLVVLFIVSVLSHTWARSIAINQAFYCTVYYALLWLCWSFISIILRWAGVSCSKKISSILRKTFMFLRSTIFVTENLLLERLFMQIWNYY